MKRFIITLLVLAIVNLPQQAQAKNNKRLSDKELTKSLEYCMDTCHITAISVVLVKGDRIIYEKALGIKSLDTKEPVGINDVYRIASISKSFSAAAIVQLIDEGKISLEDDVNDYLPFPVRNPNHPEIPITIRHFLTHTSSMWDHGYMRYWTDDKYINPAKSSTDTIASMFKKYAPGWGFHYCNRAYNMLGNIIEKASGERFDDYIRNHILLPMGITNAGFNLDSLDRESLVRIYSYDLKRKVFSGKSGRYQNVNGPKIADGTYQLGIDGTYWCPTGGMKISAKDLAKWMMTIRDNGVAPNGNRIFSEQAAKRLKTPQTPDPTKKHPYYCLGLYITPYYFDGISLLGHTGSLFGLKSGMFYDRNSDWGFVCICASSDGRPAYEDNGEKSLMSGAYHDIMHILYDQFKEQLSASEEN